MADAMLPQSQMTTVAVGSTASGAVPPGATARHAGDTLWPWLLGLVLLGGLGFLVYKVAKGKGETPGLPAGSTPDEAVPASGTADDEPVALGGRRGRRMRFASAQPVKFRYPPSGYRRGARVKRLSEEQFTRPSRSRYNLEVEDED